MSLINLLNFHHSNSEMSFHKQIIQKSSLFVTSKSIYAFQKYLLPVNLFMQLTISVKILFSLHIVRLVLLRQIYCINLQF